MSLGISSSVTHDYTRISYSSETSQYLLNNDNKKKLITEQEANDLLFPGSEFTIHDGKLQDASGHPIALPQSFSSNIQPFGSSQPLPNTVNNTQFTSRPHVLQERINSAEAQGVLLGGPLLTGLLIRAMRGMNKEREMRQELKFERQKDEAIAGLKNIEQSEKKLEAERNEAIVKLVVTVAAAGASGVLGRTGGLVAYQAITQVYTCVSKAAPIGYQYQADEAGVNMQEYQWVEKAHQQVAQEESDQLSAAREQFKGLADLIRLVVDNLSQQTNLITQ